MPAHWIVRVGCGKNFKGSFSKKIWGIKGQTTDGKCFCKNAVKGDVLWFVTNKAAGNKVVGVATYESHELRQLGPLIAVSRTNEELGWTEEGDGSWDTEIRLANGFDLNGCDLALPLVGQSNVRRYVVDKISLNLPAEWESVQRYASARRVCA